LYRHFPARPQREANRSGGIKGVGEVLAQLIIRRYQRYIC
jgi:hypothetical protein